MQGLVLCARYAFSPSAGNDAERLYEYVINKKDDEGIKQILKKYSLHTMLRLISSRDQLNPFDHKVVEAYWLGNELLDKIPNEEFGLLVKNYGGFNPRTDRIIFGNASLAHDERCTVHHSLSVMLGTIKLKEISSDVLTQINDSFIAWGNVKRVEKDNCIVVRSRLVNTNGYSIEEDKTDIVSYDPAFVSPINEGDVIAIHHGMAVDVLSLIQLANLKRYTARTLATFNKLV